MESAERQSIENESGLFFCFTITVLAYGAYFFLYLQFLNPLFVNRTLPIVFAFLIIPPLAGVFLTVISRLCDHILPRYKISPSDLIRRGVCLVLFLAALALTILPLSFPPPVRNRWVLLLLPVLILFTVRLWKTPVRGVWRESGGSRRTGGGCLKKQGFVPLLVLLAGIATALASPFLIEDDLRLVVIGIDGATWKIVDRLLDEGDLPNLSRLIEEGGRGRLASIDPCISPAVWTSISTGFLPESHGIHSFNGTLDKVKKKGFWEILSAEGKRVGLYKWLVTWPPEEVNGFLVPNWLSRDASCYPNELSHIKRRKGHRGLSKIRDVLLDVSYGLTAEAIYKTIYYKTRLALKDVPGIEINIAGERIEGVKRKDFFIRLKRLFDVDYGSCVFDGVDNFSHTLWQYMEPEKFDDVPPELIERYGDVIENHYREIDRQIGDILKTITDDAYVIIVSDHGFQAADSIRTHLPKPNRQIVEYLNVPRDIIEVSGYKFDRIFVGIKEGEGAGRAADMIEKQLSTFVIEGEGDPLFEVRRIDRKVKRYEAVFVVLARSGLSYMRGKTVLTPKGPVKYQDVLSYVPGISGDHDPGDGIFILAGPGVRKGAKLEGLSVLDIHPLVLYLFGLAVPRDIDGRLRLDLFENGALPQPVFIESYGDRVVEERREKPLTDEALERMKALGYIE